jgi:hypothetical protein
MPDPDPTRNAQPSQHDDEVDARLDELEARLARLALAQALAAEAFRPTGPLTDP